MRGLVAEVWRELDEAEEASPEYAVWKMMRQRIYNPQNKDYPDYGGKGIGIASRWDSFDNFISDMGRRPSRNHSIERIDNKGDYTPSNCRWATPSDQAKNRSEGA